MGYAVRQTINRKRETGTATSSTSKEKPNASVVTLTMESQLMPQFSGDRRNLPAPQKSAPVADD